MFPCTEGLLPPWDYWPGSTSWARWDSQTVWPNVGIPEAKQGTEQEKEEGKRKARFDEFWIGSIYNQKVWKCFISSHIEFGERERERENTISSGLRDFSSLSWPKRGSSGMSPWGCWGCLPLPATLSSSGPNGQSLELYRGGAVRGWEGNQVELPREERVARRRERTWYQILQQLREG